MSEEPICPKCGNEKVFDIYETRGCNDPNPKLHCPDCTYVWRPGTNPELDGKLHNLELALIEKKTLDCVVNECRAEIKVLLEQADYDMSYIACSDGFTVGLEDNADRVSCSYERLLKEMPGFFIDLLIKGYLKISEPREKQKLVVRFPKKGGD